MPFHDGVPATEAALQPENAPQSERFAADMSEEAGGGPFEFAEMAGHKQGPDPSTRDAEAMLAGPPERSTMADLAGTAAAAAGLQQPRFAEDRVADDDNTRKYTAGEASVTNSNSASRSGNGGGDSNTKSTGATTVGQNSHGVPTIVVQNDNSHVQHTKK